MESPRGRRPEDPGQQGRDDLARAFGRSPFDPPAVPSAHHYVVPVVTENAEPVDPWTRRPL